MVPGFPRAAFGPERWIETDLGPVEREPLSFGDLILRHFRCHGIAKPRKGFSLVVLRSCGREVEPFVGEDDIQRNAVSLVVHQPEHGLRKRISLNGAPGVEIGGGIIVLRFAKTVLIQKAKQAERLGVSVLSQGCQFPGRENVIAAGIGSGAACQRAGRGDRRGSHPDQHNHRYSRPASAHRFGEDSAANRRNHLEWDRYSPLSGHWWSLPDLSKSSRYRRATS